jgi:hypothetical protein
MENSMEFHGIQWNSTEFSMENSMEFNGIPLNFPWNSMDL